MKKYLAEFIGTFGLVLGGCGTAIFAGAHVGFAGVALAFGLTVLVGAYGLGHLSGAHFNPAVTLGLWAGGRVDAKDIVPYIVAQILGAIVAATTLYLILNTNGKEIGGFAANGYGLHSPDRFSLTAGIIAEFVLTFMFLIVILGATDSRAPKGFAGVAIGLALTLIHLISIPITNTSVNPARSISQGLFVGDWALAELWMFIVVPIAGALLAGVAYKSLFKAD